MLRQVLLASMCGALLACSDTATPDAELATEPAAKSDIVFETLMKQHPVALAEITPDVWVHTTNYTVPGQNPIASNGLVVIDGEELILVDGAWGELATVSLIQTVQDKFEKPVTKMVTTHYHPDRSGGVDAAEALGVEVLTHPDTPRLAYENGYPVPNKTVGGLKEPGSRTRLGAVEIAYPGAGHTVDNLVVYVPEANVLYGGCAVRGAGVKTMGNTQSADMEAWPKSLAWVKETYPNTAVVVPGHGKGADLSLIDATIAMLANANSEMSGDSGEAP